MSRNSTSSTPRWVPWILTKPALEARSMPVRSLCPDLIDHQLSDCQWIPRRCVNGFTIEHQRVARVVTVVGKDQSVAHDRVLLSPNQHWLSRLP
jgi:hypothetical protein